ncbi:hypothetical protein NC652_024355 [Populus alba x Populus x berolinensis]|nr:hypothetical protein NC652_024355 [Populus alba x Populus x berolinensis]
MDGVIKHPCPAVLYFSLFLQLFDPSEKKKQLLISKNAGQSVFKGQELRPPGLSKNVSVYFKRSDLVRIIEGHFGQWLVGIRSRFRCDNCLRQRCCKWQKVGLYSSQVLLSATFSKILEKGQRWFSFEIPQILCPCGACIFLRNLV